MPSLSQLGGQFSSRIGIEEKILNDIVNDIGSDHDTVMNLGFALDFFKVSIDKYEALNNKSGKVSNAGTREMMFDWKRNASPEKQIAKLREALIKAKLTEIADTHLPVSDDTMKRNLQTKATTLKTSETQTVVPSSLTTKAALYFNPLRRVYADPMKRSLQTKVAILKTSKTQTVEPSSLTAKTDTMKRNLKEKATTLKTSETQTAGPSSLIAKAESPGLLCLKCDRVTAQITDVINTKRCEKAVHSKVRNLKGRECLMQLMKGFDSDTKKLDGRYDVITLTTADVKLGDEVYPFSRFDGYKEHRVTRCKGCSQQVGWYYIPEDTKSAPFHALWLQCLIYDSYDSDNSLNAFFAKNQTEE